MLELLTEEVPCENEEELLYHILSIAVSAEHINTQNCAFLLEGVESKKGFVFLLTVKNSRRKFKIKKNLISAIYYFEKLEDFCKLSGMNKTNVVERAVEKYIEENMELVKEVAKKL